MISIGDKALFTLQFHYKGTVLPFLFNINGRKQYKIKINHNLKHVLSQFCVLLLNNENINYPVRQLSLVFVPNKSVFGVSWS